MTNKAATRIFRAPWLLLLAALLPARGADAGDGPFDWLALEPTRAAPGQVVHLSGQHSGLDIDAYEVVRVGHVVRVTFFLSDVLVAAPEADSFALGSFDAGDYFIECYVTAAGVPPGYEEPPVLFRTEALHVGAAHVPAGQLWWVLAGLIAALGLRSIATRSGGTPRR